MRITVRDGRGLNLRVPLPTGLLLNPVTARALAQGMAYQNVSVSGWQLMRLFDAVRAFRNQHPEWCLVEVQTCDGVWVKVEL